MQFFKGVYMDSLPSNEVSYGRMGDKAAWSSVAIYDTLKSEVGEMFDLAIKSQNQAKGKLYIHIVPMEEGGHKMYIDRNSANSVTKEKLEEFFEEVFSTNNNVLKFGKDDAPLKAFQRDFPKFEKETIAKFQRYVKGPGVFSQMVGKAGALFGSKPEEGAGAGTPEISPKPAPAPAKVAPAEPAPKIPAGEKPLDAGERRAFINSLKSKKIEGLKLVKLNESDINPFYSRKDYADKHKDLENQQPQIDLFQEELRGMGTKKYGFTPSEINEINEQLDRLKYSIAS